MTICAGVHAPDDGRDLLIPLGHYIARLATGRDFALVYDRATDEPIPADVLERWNQTDWEAAAPHHPRFRYRPCIRALNDAIDCALLDVIFPTLDRVVVRVERRCEPHLRTYLRHRAEIAELDGRRARRLFDDDAAGDELDRRGAVLRSAADVLEGLPVCAPDDEPTAADYARLAEGAPR